MFLCECLPERVGNNVGRLIDIAQPVRLIHHNQIPRGGVNIGSFIPRELVGADYDSFSLLEWAEVALFDCLIVELRLKDSAR